MIEFSYREEESRFFGKVWRPVVEVHFIDKQGNMLDCLMYLDSGADMILIPQQLGETLGFMKGNEPVIDLGGIGTGNISAIIKIATIILGKVRFDCRVAWALTDDVPPLLGRRDIFDKFKITFDEKAKKVIFEEY